MIPNVDNLHIDWSKGANPAALERVFHTHGAAIVRGLVPDEALRDIRREIRDLIALASRTAGLPTPSGEPFDAGFIDLCAADPTAGPGVFGACRRLTSVHRLTVVPELLAMSRYLMKTEMVSVLPYTPVRIDWRERAGALLSWHQDYPYAQDSMDAVIYWIPLCDVDEHNGGLRVALGSHAAGVLPVKMIPPPADGSHDLRDVRIADPDVAARWPQQSLPVKAGEALILSTLLLHRSQPNHTDRIRWTVQVRHGNLTHPTALEKRWPCGHHERHWFDESHPEYVVERPETRSEGSA